MRYKISVAINGVVFRNWIVDKAVFLYMSCEILDFCAKVFS